MLILTLQIDNNSIAFSGELKFLAANILDDTFLLSSKLPELNSIFVITDFTNRTLYVFLCIAEGKFIERDCEVYEFF